VVKACLQKTNIPILLVVDNEESLTEVDWQALPIDDFITRPVSIEALLIRLRMAEARMQRVFDNNPLSRLPGNTSILRAIQRAIDEGRERPMAVCYLDIDNFKPYNDHYGFSRGDEVILVVARVLVNVWIYGPASELCGHVAVMILLYVPEALAAVVCERVLANFTGVRNSFS